MSAFSANLNGSSLPCVLKELIVVSATQSFKQLILVLSQDKWVVEWASDSPHQSLATVCVVSDLSFSSPIRFVQGNATVST